MKETVLAKDVKTVLHDLRQTSHFRYFFYDLTNDGFLSFSSFRSFLIRVLSDKDSVRPHFVSSYMKTTASKKPKETYLVIRDSKPSDSSISRTLLEVVLLLEDKYAAKLVHFIKQYLIQKRSAEGKLLGNLLTKYLDAQNSEEAKILFDFLCRPIVHRVDRAVTKEFPAISRNEAEGRLEQYEFAEVLEAALPMLIDQIPSDVTKILEHNLLLALDIESKGNKGRQKEDFSYIWRPAIEDHEQNYDFGKIKEVLVSCLRDSLMQLASRQLDKSLPSILARYCRSHYTIFKRLALFVMSNNADHFGDLIKMFIHKKKNLDDHRIRHELFGLLQKNFPILETDTQQFILKWIERGPSTDWWIRRRKKEDGKAPSVENVQRFVKHWKLQRYWSIREHLSDKAEYMNQLEKEVGTPEHPDFPSWHESSAGGHESALTVEQLREMTNEQLLSVLKNPPQVQREDPIFRHEGLGMSFESVVKENPERYLPFASEIAKANVLPIFIKNYFRALRESWASHKLNWTDDLDSLARLVAVGDPNPYGWGIEVRSSLRLDLSRLVEGIVSDKSITLSDEQLERLKSILLPMLGDPDPNETNKPQDYSPNNDWSFVALNHTGGEVLHALIKYALCYARKHSEPSSRLESDVRDGLHSILLLEKRLSILSVFGTYLANLWYLDAPWVKQNLLLLFPKQDKRRANAIWDAYLKFNSVYKDVYESLKFQYAKTVRSLRGKEPKTPRDDQRLAQHLALIYWRGWDDLNLEPSLVRQFFRYAPKVVRVSFIRQIGLGLREMKEQSRLAKEDAAWKIPRGLWEWRLQSHRHIADTMDYADEFGAFLDWLPHVPENIVTLQNLISRTLRKRSANSHTGAITEYLANNAKDHPLESVQLLFDFFSLFPERGYCYFDSKEVQIVLEAALNNGGEAKKLAAKIASSLGEHGYFQFKSIWDKAKESTRVASVAEVT